MVDFQLLYETYLEQNGKSINDLDVRVTSETDLDQMYAAAAGV
jgi:hypothetical protein